MPVHKSARSQIEGRFAGILSSRNAAWAYAIGRRGVPAFDALDAADEIIWLEGLVPGHPAAAATRANFLNYYRRGALSAVRGHARRIVADGANFNEALRLLTIKAAEIAHSDDEIVDAVAEVMCDRGAPVIFDRLVAIRVIRSARAEYVPSWGERP